MHVELNKKLFSIRISKIYDGWKSGQNDDDFGSIADVDALFLSSGDPAGEDEQIKKGTSFQQWLLGYEFPSTFILFQKEKISILCSATKAKILSQLEGSHDSISIEIFAQTKAKDTSNDALSKFCEIYASHTRIGTFTKETYTGKLITDWEQMLNTKPSKPELVDMSLAVSAAMAVKDQEEMKSVQVASNLTSTLLKHHVGPRLETILDKEAKISHEVVAAQAEARLGSGEKGPDMKVWLKGKGLEKIDWDLVEFCYTPLIMSRSTKGGFDLRYTAESSSDNIAHKGVFLISLGMKYKSYCANIGRTFIVDPTKDQEAQYQLLLSLQAELLSFIKAGTIARDVYQHALSFIREKDASLEKNFVKSIGFGMGVEFRESAYVLSPKNARVLKENMVVNLDVGFTDLVSDGSKYALRLADTIKIGTKDSTLLTEGTKSIKDTLFFLDGESDPEIVSKPTRKPPVQPRANGSPQKAVKAGKVLRNQKRATQDDVHATAVARLNEHQRELHSKLQKEGLERYARGAAGRNNKEGKGWKKFQSYKGEGALPPQIERLQIYVDRKAQSVIMPINGFAVPFHISTIKNASKNDEGEYTYLRINFQTPGQVTGKKDDTPFEDPDATFIRSVSYRSTDSNRMDNLHKQITEVKRDANKREAQKKEMADVVEQDSLIELKGGRPTRMQEAFLRPALDGKRLPGEVEIHSNGLRYQSHTGQRVDILFSNIKHLFFQPCDHELLVIVHVHLKSPIMIGKKKTSDVQFFREASDAQFDETGNRKRKHRYGDEDEIEMEQQERKRRQMLNREIKSFAEKIAEAASTSLGETLELDIPFRELSFEGVPYRTSVRMQPTTECLVHLTDPPFLVITLSEIEVVSLERVQYSLKQFDMCFVFKDFTKPPLHINSVASAQMDDVKNWLDSVDVAMAEGPVNLNWGPIMKHINENPYEFFEQGGWSFLGASNGAESELSQSSGSESEFGADSDIDESASSESEFSDASGSDSGSDFGDDSGEESGQDWDELERKAAKSDAKKVELGRMGHDSDDDAPSKKKSNGKSNGKGKPSKPNGRSNGKR